VARQGMIFARKPNFSKSQVAVLESDGLPFEKPEASFRIPKS
jgi:hypothetical protein